MTTTTVDREPVTPYEMTGAITALSTAYERLEKLYLRRIRIAVLAVYPTARELRVVGMYDESNKVRLYPDDGSTGLAFDSAGEILGAMGEELADLLRKLASVTDDDYLDVHYIDI